MSYSRLLSANDVSKKLKIAESTVWLYARTNKIPQPIKIGNGTTRWIEESIDSFIKKISLDNNGASISLPNNQNYISSGESNE